MSPKVEIAGLKSKEKLFSFVDYISPSIHSSSLFFRFIARGRNKSILHFLFFQFLLLTQFTCLRSTSFQACTSVRTLAERVVLNETHFALKHTKNDVFALRRLLLLRDDPSFLDSVCSFESLLTHTHLFQRRKKKEKT